MTAADEQAMKERRTAVRGRMLVLVPLIAFLALAGLFMVRLGTGDPSRIPSALIGHAAPVTKLPALPGSRAQARRCPASIAQRLQAKSRSSMCGLRGACPAATRPRF